MSETTWVVEELHVYGLTPNAVFRWVEIGFAYDNEEEAAGFLARRRAPNRTVRLVKVTREVVDEEEKPT